MVDLRWWMVDSGFKDPVNKVTKQVTNLRQF